MVSSNDDGAQPDMQESSLLAHYVSEMRGINEVQAAEMTGWLRAMLDIARRSGGSVQLSTAESQSCFWIVDRLRAIFNTAGEQTPRTPGVALQAYLLAPNESHIEVRYNSDWGTTITIIPKRE